MRWRGPTRAPGRRRLPYKVARRQRYWPAASPAARLKGIEDALDAVVCAWVACEHLAGRTQPYGDRDATIWLPRPRHGGDRP